MRFARISFQDKSHRLAMGGGFLLLLSSVTGQAQRGVEVQLSGGMSVVRPSIERHNLPRNFRFNNLINAGAALRLILPVSPRIGIGLEQRVTGLNNEISYNLENSTASRGFGQNTVHQSGVSLRLYDVWTPGARWALDVALTGSYGWGSSFWRRQEYNDQLFGSYPPASSLPTRTAPLVVVNSTYRRGTPLVGTELLLHYELGPKHSLLLTAAYQYGLHPLLNVRSTRLEYVDEAGAVRQGSFAYSSGGSYATMQLGYGLRLGSLEPAATRHRTPRYSHSVEDEINYDEPSAE